MLNDLPDAVGSEELGRRQSARDDAGEGVHGRAVAVHRGQQPLHLLGRGFQGGQLRGEVIDRQCLRIAGQL